MHSIVKCYNEAEMKINDSIYYTPHQVASFFSISKDTLLYYDRIGLFSPAMRKENGYRCYTASQLNELDRILTLRDLGIPISSIKEAAGDPSTPSFLSLLENEEESIRRKIDECNALLSIVSSIRKSINTAASAEKGRLYLSDEVARPVIRVPIRTASETESTDPEWQEAYSSLMADADCKEIISIGSIVRFDEARRYLGNICREVYATFARPLDEMLPAGRYASMYFSGSLDNLSSFYRQFFSALDSSGLECIGDIYEELSISTVVTKDEREHVTRLMVQVRMPCAQPSLQQRANPALS